MKSIFKEINSCLKYRGFATSTFQEDPFSNNDIWGKFLESGVNLEIRKIWQSRTKRSPQKFFHQLKQTLIQTSDKIVNEYHKNGVNELTARVIVVQLDLDIIRGVVKTLEQTEPYARVFVTAIIESIHYNHARNLFTQVLVNPYTSCIGKACRKDCKKFELKLADFYKILSKQFEAEYLISLDKVCRMDLFPQRDLNYWKKYIDRIVEFGGNSFRMSAEWSRLLNSDGEFYKPELDKFISIIKYAQAKNVDITVCFHHFTLPDWIDNGWTNPRIPEEFSNYVVTTLDALRKAKALPNRILTINEPNSFIPAGYLDGSWPPFKRLRLLACRKAIANSIKAHAMAYEKVKSKFPKIPIGFTYNFPVFKPYHSWLFIDRIICRVARFLNTYWFRKLLKNCLIEGKFLFDFLGFQYYNKFHVGLLNSNIGANTGVQNVPERLDPMINGWSRYPQGMKDNLLKVDQELVKYSELLHQELPDIFITETGVPSIINPQSELEILFKNLNSAIHEMKSKVQGILIWTLNDNFEWAAGYTMPVGYYRWDGSDKPK